MTAAELRAVRLAAGLTQRELGERLGLSHRTIQDLEAGLTPVRKLHRLALIGAGFTVSGED